MEEGDVCTKPVFFGSGPWTGPMDSGETCPRRPRALKTVNNGQAFPQEKYIYNNIIYFFLNEPIAGTARLICKTFQANTRKSKCVGPTLSHI